VLRRCARRSFAALIVGRSVLWITVGRLPLALAELGLIDEYAFVMHPGSPAAGDCSPARVETCRLETRAPRGVAPEP